MSPPQLVASTNATGSGADGESDEEMDWEEVAVPHAGTTAASENVPNYNLESAEEPGLSSGADAKAGAGNIEITLKKVQKVDPKRKKQAEQNAELRALRLTCHKIHTVALLSNALIRNKWINDPLLHARLLSLTPLALQASFTMITKSRHPEAAKRGRLFESAITRLTQWWFEEFFEIEGDGHIKSRTFDQVQKVLFEIDFEDNDGEVIRSSKSLMKHTLKRRGSRDVSSQLFTALCRALGIPARLVVSLQSVPWQASAGKPKPSGKKLSKKGKEKATVLSEPESQGSDVDTGGAEIEDDDMEEVSIPELRDEKPPGKDGIFPGEGQTLSGVSTPTLKEKEKPLSKHVVKLRKAKSSGQRLGSSTSSRQSTPVPPIGGYPPVFWTEVYSKPDGRWLPVDPTRYIVNKRKTFEPPSHDRNNRMVYVVGIEEDGYCRDVTARYAKDYGTKTSKAQLGGKGRKEWWESVMVLVSRPYRLVRDDVEDEEIEYNKYTEGMPTSVAGFKNHPLYTLEQHLRREEVIFPKTEIGKFRGEPVYPRSNIVPLKTAENWIRSGRRVKEGAQALKWVKQRAVTIHRRRAMELAQQEGDEMLQGLYSEVQTELYIPSPIVDGVIPKNDFGNIDLYTPSMLPEGAAHIPYKGVAKVARRLGFDYAEAVTSFEFKKGRAFPVLSGIVVASENEETLLEAYWEAEREAQEKEQTKRKDRVIKRWTRLIHGLRIRQRLQEQYANGDESSTSVLRHDDGEMATEVEQPGGFLTEADAIVQPFHLPRFEHSTYQFSSSNVGTAAERDEAFNKISTTGNVDRLIGTRPLKNPNLGAYLEQDDGDDLEEILPATSGQIITSAEGRAPKSMRELANENAARQMGTDTTEFIGGRAQMPVDTLDMVSSMPAKQSDKRTTRSSEKRSSSTSAAKPRQSENGTPTKINKRRRPARKRNGTPSSISSDTSSDRDEGLAINSLGGNGEDSSEHANNSSQQRADSSNSILKRKRSVTVSTAPSPSTRVLRMRVPKSTEKIKAEKEAEAAYRKAIAE